MSDSEIQRIWQAINNLAQKVERLATNIENQGELLAEVRAEIRLITTQGCSKAGSHQDHEERIRSLETSRNVAVGGAGILGGIFGTVGGWLLTRIGGGH